MKKFKKLIPAFCMLLVSAIMLGSSTFAWFSMNETVTASGMQVKAKTTQTFLLISSTKTTPEDIQTENKINADLTVADSEMAVLPSAHETISNTTDAAVAEGKWYTAFGSDPTKVDMDATTKKTLTSFGGYVIAKQVYVTVAKNSVSVKDLKVSAEITNKATGTISQVKVLVTSTTAAVELSSANTNPTTALTATDYVLDSTKVVALNIYIFIDGTDSAVYTNNFDSLDGAAITLTFSCTAAA